MRVLKTQNKLCLSCMEYHDVDIIEMDFELGFINGEEVRFKGIYEYCEREDTVLETQDMIEYNHLICKAQYYRNKIISESKNV